MKEAIVVSHEMKTFLGYGPFGAAPMPADPVVFYFDGFAETANPVCGYRDRFELQGLQATPLVFVVARSACRRLFSVRPGGPQVWHLPSPLRMLAISLIDCEADGEARDTLRLARSIELLCQIHAALAAGALVPLDGAHTTLGELDVARVATARRIVDQDWHRKLTVNSLAQAAGINRDKLVRGFRELYGETVAEALCARRLSEARRMLLATDLSVSAIAYRCSYLSNASFTRAFTRRFGVAPSELRRMGVAA